MTQRVPLKSPAGGFGSIRYPANQLVPCAADPDPFNYAQEVLDRQSWLGNLTAVHAICDYCIGCPIIQQCADAAVAERFSGIAGGRMWKNGKDKTEAVAA